MLDLKKYSNGKFFDSVNRKYLKTDSIREYIKKGEQIKVTLTTTGEDITKDILAKYSGKTGMKYNGLLNTEGLIRWITETIDKRINKMLDVMNLPTRDQITELNASIKAIDVKIQSFESVWKEQKEQKKKRQQKEKKQEGTWVKNKPAIEKEQAVAKDEKNVQQEKTLSNQVISGIDNAALQQITCENIFSDIEEMEGMGKNASD